jgi:hypothetical protein
MVNINTIIGLVVFNFIFISNKYKVKKMWLNSPTPDYIFYKFCIFYHFCILLNLDLV